MKVKELYAWLDKMMEDNPTVAEADIGLLRSDGREVKLYELNGLHIKRDFKTVTLGIDSEGRELSRITLSDRAHDMANNRPNNQLAPLGIPVDWLKNPFGTRTGHSPCEFDMKNPPLLKLTQEQKEAAISAGLNSKEYREELYRQEVDRRMREEERRILAHRLDGFPGEQRQQLIEVFMHMSEHRRSKLKD